MKTENSLPPTLCWASWVVSMCSHSISFISITCSFCCIPNHVLVVEEEFSKISYCKYLSISSTWCLGRIFLSSRSSRLQYIYHAWCRFTATKFLIIEMAPSVYPPSAFSPDIFLDSSTLLSNTTKRLRLIDGNIFNVKLWYDSLVGLL